MIYTASPSLLSVPGFTSRFCQTMTGPTTRTDLVIEGWIARYVRSGAPVALSYFRKEHAK